MTMNQFYKNLSVPTGKIDMVLDTDAYNEIDDQYAIAYMLRSSDRLNVKALYAAPFFNPNSESPSDGMYRSYEEIKHIITLAGRADLADVTYKGSVEYLANETTPVISDAANHLVALAKAYSSENPLYVVAIGAITNVASALLIDPSIAENIVVVWLGGHSLELGAGEFNMKQDIAAARVVYNSGVPYVQLPCMGVVSEFRISEPELDYWLVGKNPLCDYLAQHTKDAANRYAKGLSWTRVIWDVTAVAWLLNDGERFMKGKIISRNLPNYDKQYNYTPGGMPMTYVYQIRRDKLMQDLIAKLTAN